MTSKYFYRNRSAFSIYFLIFIWTFGLICGAGFASTTELNISLWMYSFLNSRVSILSLLFWMFIPFIISLFAIRFNQGWIIHILALIKSFLYSYWRCLMIYIFVRAGWFVNLVVFFSDSCCILLLLNYWISGLFQMGHWTYKPFLVSLLLSGIICVFDFLFIATLLTTVLA